MHRQIEPDEPFHARYSCTVEKNIPPNLRVDRYAAEKLGLLTRSQVKARKLRVRLNGREVKVSRVLKGGEALDFFWNDAEPLDLIPEDIPLEIVYEDKRVAVINKAQGMVVHPGAGNYSGTLANALCFRMRGRGNVFPDSIRPGIVHRLDKDTSGLIITAWDDEALFFLSSQFRQRSVTKTYAALVQGCPKQREGRIDEAIGRSKTNRKLFSVDAKGKPSLTLYKVVKTFGNYSLLLLRPKTGRTHQLRVHLKHLGCPILGDPLYSRPDPRFPALTLMLHAKRLTIRLPETGARTFRTALPERFESFLMNFRKRP